MQRSISDEESAEQLIDAMNSTFSGELDTLKENVESNDLDVTILKSLFDDKENKAAECFQGAYGLSNDNCAVCGETKSQFMLQC